MHFCKLCLLKIPGTPITQDVEGAVAAAADTTAWVVEVAFTVALLAVDVWREVAVFSTGVIIP